MAALEGGVGALGRRLAAAERERDEWQARARAGLQQGGKVDVVDGGAGAGVGAGAGAGAGAGGRKRKADGNAM